MTNYQYGVSLEKDTFICGHCFNKHNIVDCDWSVPAKSRYGIIICPFCRKTNKLASKVIIAATIKE